MLTFLNIEIRDNHSKCLRILGSIYYSLQLVSSSVRVLYFQQQESTGEEEDQEAQAEEEMERNEEEEEEEEVSVLSCVVL